MTNRVQLASCVYYKVAAIHIKNDPDKGSGVYIELHSEPNSQYPRSCSNITAFGAEHNPPEVFVDGVKIEVIQSLRIEPEEVD